MYSSGAHTAAGACALQSVGACLLHRAVRPNAFPSAQSRLQSLAVHCLAGSREHLHSHAAKQARNCQATSLRPLNRRSPLVQVLYLSTPIPLISPPSFLPPLSYIPTYQARLCPTPAPTNAPHSLRTCLCAGRTGRCPTCTCLALMEWMPIEFIELPNRVCRLQRPLQQRCQLLLRSLLTGQCAPYPGDLVLNLCAVDLDNPIHRGLYVHVLAIHHHLRVMQS